GGGAPRGGRGRAPEAGGRPWAGGGAAALEGGAPPPALPGRRGRPAPPPRSAADVATIRDRRRPPRRRRGPEAGRAPTGAGRRGRAPPRTVHSPARRRSTECDRPRTRRAGRPAPTE